MNSRLSAFFITVFESCEPTATLPYMGNQRTWGYYLSYDEAVEALHENRTDMRETIYNYAVIEEFPVGICQYAENRQWFMWDENRGGYYEIDEPECVKHCCNFALG